MTALPNSFEDASDDDFLSGEGAVDTGARIRCPYCGVLNDIALDLGGGSAQEYVQDCEVCCRPWQIRVLFDAWGRVVVEVSAADEP